MDTSGADITVIKPNSRRHKKIEISKEAIFSIRFGSTGKEDIYYTYDTLIGNDFTVDEVRKFIAGEQDAQRGYHAIGISIAAFAVGFASGATFGGDIFSFVPPFLFEGIMTYPVIHVRHRTVKDLKIANTDPYLYGYYLVASNKRMLRSLLWGGIGIAGGIIANIEIINRTQ